MNTEPPTGVRVICHSEVFEIFSQASFSKSDQTLPTTYLENEWQSPILFAFHQANKKHILGHKTSLPEIVRDHFLNDEIEIESAEAIWLNQLLVLRNGVIDLDIDAQLAQAVAKEIPLFSEWSGEAWFCVGMAKSCLHNFVEAAVAFEKAHQEFSLRDAPLRALQAQCYKIETLMKLYPTKNFHFDLIALSKKAELLNSLWVQGQIRSLLAWQSLKNKNFKQALGFAKTASEELSNYTGTLEHELNQARKTLLQVILRPSMTTEELKNLSEEFLKMNAPRKNVPNKNNDTPTNNENPFAAVRAFDLIFEQLLEEPDSISLIRHKPGSIWPQFHLKINWCVNGSEVPSSKKISKMELKLIELLKQRPCNRKELIENIYGLKVDSEASDNRLKNLLSRFRKKFPEHLSRRDGRYSLSEAGKREFAHLSNLNNPSTVDPNQLEIQ